MNTKAYIKNCKRGPFKWGCVESYGDGSSVDIEEVSLKGRLGTITRQSENCFTAEVDYLNNDPVYDEKEFTRRSTAREWVERLIMLDINKDIVVTEYQLDMMRHTIGLNYKKKPYRNRFFTDESDKDWNELIEKGLAAKGEQHPNNDEHVYFWLTKQGVEYVTGKSISDRVYKEL